uniref:24 kDa family member n=1 Tax=Rhipicephalus zambeziensis TaxID=60191 RepID=A0A224YD29_9ACAR
MGVRKVLYCLTIFATLACSHAQCDNVLLPNVGNLSQCLDRRLGECSSNAETLEEDLTLFFNCMFDELPRATDPAATLFNLVDLYQAVLSELELPVNVTPVATLLCYRLNFSLEACAQPAVSGDARCGSLLSVFFSSSFAVRQCADRSALICFEDEQPQMRTLKALFGMLTCVFEGAPADVRPRLALSLACPLIQLLRQALGQFTQVISWPIFAEQVRDSVEQLTILLLHLASCEDGSGTTLRTPSTQ